MSLLTFCKWNLQEHYEMVFKGQVQWQIFILPQGFIFVLLVISIIIFLFPDNIVIFI